MLSSPTGTRRNGESLFQRNRVFRLRFLLPPSQTSCSMAFLPFAATGTGKSNFNLTATGSCRIFTDFPAFSSLFYRVYRAFARGNDKFKRKKRDFLKIFLDILFRIGYNIVASNKYEPLAQLAEHLTFNQGVRGSNPRWFTKKAVHTVVWAAFFYEAMGFETNT